MSKEEFFNKYIKEDEYDDLEDAKMTEIIHKNARKVKRVNKRHNVLEIAVYVSQIGVWIGIGIMIGVLWLK